MQPKPFCSSFEGFVRIGDRAVNLNAVAYVTHGAVGDRIYFLATAAAGNQSPSGLAYIDVSPAEASALRAFIEKQRPLTAGPASDNTSASQEGEKSRLLSEDEGWQTTSFGPQG